MLYLVNESGSYVNTTNFSDGCCTIACFFAELSLRKVIWVLLSTMWSSPGDEFPGASLESLAVLLHHKNFAFFMTLGRPPCHNDNPTGFMNNAIDPGRTICLPKIRFGNYHPVIPIYLASCKSSWLSKNRFVG